MKREEQNKELVKSAIMKQLMDLQIETLTLVMSKAKLSEPFDPADANDMLRLYTLKIYNLLEQVK